MDLITIGRVIKPHGVDGTLKIIPLTDFPQHFKFLEELYIVKEDVIKTSLEHVRFHQRHILIKVKDCSNRTCAQAWIGAEVAIDSKDLWPLKTDEYYHFQVVGLRVVTQEGEYLGQIKEILSAKSNEVFVVHKDNREYLLPAIKEVIKKVDLERRVMTVHLLEGLI